MSYYNKIDVKKKELQQIKEHIKAQMKGKTFKNLATKDKDLLLEAMAKMLGLIE